MSSENIRENFMKKKVYLRRLKIVYYDEKRQKKFRRETAVPPPFSHSSILFSTKATAVPNFRAVTLL